MNKYDLVIIGAGPAGYAAAMRAVDFKKKTLLIERNRLGGAGITNGALSSKTWWELSRETASFRKSLNRYNIHTPQVAYADVQGEVCRDVNERKAMLEEHIHQLQRSRNDQLLDLKYGQAKLRTPNRIEILAGEQK